MRVLGWGQTWGEDDAIVEFIFHAFTREVILLILKGLVFLVRMFPDDQIEHRKIEKYSLEDIFLLIEYTLFL